MKDSKTSPTNRMKHWEHKKKVKFKQVGTAYVPIDYNCWLTFLRARELYMLWSSNKYRMREWLTLQELASPPGVQLENGWKGYTHLP